jgi:2-isopropylmalate synthase
MDATRSDPDFVCRLVEAAITAGATTVNIPDTVGYSDPAEFDKFIGYIFDNVKNIDQAIISVHCHNDLGMATANSLAAVRRGARQIECTVNGIGERAGNAALEEVVMALHTRKDYYGPTTNIDLSEIYKTSRMLSSYTGLLVQANKAVVGANAFAHESGIHQDGMLKDRSTFEIMDPREVGVGESSLVLGKHSGRHAFKNRLSELGFELSAEYLNRVFLRFKKLADQKKVIVDADLEAIVTDEIRSPAEVFHLDQLQVTCGDHSIPTASVRLIAPNGDIVADAALGNGPVDAIYKAINRLVQAPNRLIEFSVHSVTGGLDAVAETTIRIQSNDGRVYSGRGASTDIILASAKAYMNALNKLLAAKERTTAANASVSEEGSKK